MASTSTIPLTAIVASIGDPDGTRTITAIVALLVVLGVGLAMLAIWLFKTTRPDPELLAPLDVMGERKWRRADPVWQRRRLDQVRPGLARPLSPSVAPPEFDEAFDLGPTASGFDDLHDDPASPAEPPAPADSERADEAPETTGDEMFEATGDDASEDAVEDRNEGAEGGEDGVDDGLEQPAEPVEASGSDAEPGATTPARELASGASTPTSIARPTLDDLPDHELDPALLEIAMRDLEQELAARRHLVEGDDQR